MRKIHLLGVVLDWTCKRYPYFSCDSSTWVIDIFGFGNSDFHKGRLPRYTKDDASLKANLHAIRGQIKKSKTWKPKLPNYGNQGGLSGMIKLKLSTKEKAFVDAAKEQGFTLEHLDTNNGPRAIIRAYRTTVAELNPNEWNPNKTDERTNQAIAESLLSFGQVLECVAIVHPDGDGLKIIDGEHRFNHLSDEISVNVLFGYSESELKKLTIILNETRGNADKIELAQLLSSISDELGDSLGEGLPYGDTDLTEIIKLADVDWDQFAEDFEPDNATELINEYSSDDGFTRIVCAIPNEALEVINQAYALVGDERDLHQDKQVAWGQVLESICADFLAMPR